MKKVLKEIKNLAVKPKILTTECSCGRVYFELPDNRYQVAYEKYFQIECVCGSSTLAKPRNQDIFDQAPITLTLQAIGGINPDDVDADLSILEEAV